MPQKEIEIDFQKYWLVLKRHWFLAFIVCGLTTAAAAFLGSNRELTYQAQAKLLFESSDPVASLVGLEGSGGNLEPLTNQDNPLDTQVEIVRSKPIAEQTIQQLNIKNGEGELLDADDLLENLEVDDIPGTDVLEVNYQSPDPALSAAVVNTVIAIFLKENIQANRAAAVSAQDFISSQLPDSEAKVSESETALRQFKEANGIVDLTEESRNTVETLSNVDNSLTQLRSELADRNAQFSKLQQRLRLSPQQAYTVGLISESPGVQETVEELQTVQSQLAIARTRYRESHPQIEAIRSQEDALLRLLQQRLGLTLGTNQVALPADDLQAGELERGLILEFLQVDAERSGLQQQIQELAASQSARRSRAQRLPGLEREQRELERKLNAAQTTYETLLDSLQQAQVLENQEVGNARVIALADVPEESVLPSIKLYLLAGGVLGALLGIAAAFIADLLDQSVKSVKHGQTLYDYPLLGVIPNWRKRKPSRSRELEAPRILVGERHRVPIAESYRSLQANLKFSYLDGPLKVIAVTSAVGGEGKSEVAANLALTLAQLEHRVLLIDADMRSPIQHHVWDVANLRGLSNFVARQVPLKEAIIRKQSHLHLLTAGSIPPNPLAIIDSKQMLALLDVCRQTYDYVIIDTPPLLGLADTPTLGRISDGVLLALRPSVVDVPSIKAARGILDQSNQRVLGVVANGIAPKSSSERYFYHHQEYVPDREWEMPAGGASVAGERGGERAKEKAGEKTGEKTGEKIGKKAARVGEKASVSGIQRSR